MRRWVLGEQNLPPQSILEQNMDKARALYSPQDFSKLSQLFLDLDRKLSFGVGCKFLLRVYKSMGIQLDEKTKKDILVKSGYFRKLNQYSASITLDDFLAELHERYSALKSSGNSQFANLSLEEFVQLFTEASKSKLPDQSKWEALHFHRRSEIMTLNSVYKEEKLAKMLLILNDRPTADYTEIVKELEESSFSTSIYEKIFIIKAELDYIKMMLKSYEQRPSLSSSALQKKKSLEDKQTKFEEYLRKESADFAILFSKPLSSYYY
jgi:hypothetical protein